MKSKKFFSFVLLVGVLLLFCCFFVHSAQLYLSMESQIQSGEDYLTVIENSIQNYETEIANLTLQIESLKKPNENSISIVSDQKNDSKNYSKTLYKLGRSLADLKILQIHYTQLQEKYETLQQDYDDTFKQYERRKSRGRIIAVGSILVAFFGGYAAGRVF